MTQILAAVSLAFALLASCTGQHHAARCPMPRANIDGTYSSYHIDGTMPSGVTVRLDDGDLWTCRNGIATVHAPGGAQ